MKEQDWYAFIDEAERDGSPRVFNGPPHGSIDHKRMYPKCPSNSVPATLRRLRLKVAFSLLLASGIAFALWRAIA